MKEKAEYCLNCKTRPCTKGCPLENNIPEFIEELKNGDIKKAYQILSKTTVLQPICGLICPHMSQCEGNCVRRFKGEPTSIGEMETYIGKIALEENFPFDEINESKKEKRVAVIGSGPAGLTCSAFLARKGYNVTIFEKYNKLGGILSHGIPEIRLPKEILEKNIQKILDLGIEVEYNKSLGKDFTLESLKEEYDAIFIAIGSNVPMKMNIENEDIYGVYGGNKLLEENNHPNYEGKKVAVIGGGNVAMDCSRIIKQKGAKEVYVIYRRAEEQMPAERKEIEEAKEEGVTFLFQNNIVKIIPKENEKVVGKIECIKTELIQKEGDSRLSPVDIKGSNYQMDIDYVIMAIGSIPQKEIVDKLKLKTNSKGYIEVDQNNMTSEKGVFAGGDIIGEKATVAWAARSGRNAAEAIIEYLR